MLQFASTGKSYIRTQTLATCPFEALTHTQLAHLYPCRFIKHAVRGSGDMTPALREGVEEVWGISGRGDFQLLVKQIPCSRVFLAVGRANFWVLSRRTSSQRSSPESLFLSSATEFSHFYRLGKLPHRHGRSNVVSWCWVTWPLTWRWGPGRAGLGQRAGY